MGIKGGDIVFVDCEVTITEKNLYIPASIRRYPYMLARLRPDAQELSLCFDPTSDAIGAFEEGEALFDGDQPTEFTKGILQFNAALEQAGGRTPAFVKELKEQSGRASRRERVCQIVTISMVTVQLKNKTNHEGK